MSALKHTPGPWSVEQAHEGGGLVARPGCAQFSLQIVPLADAHLIAAAPELLAACQLLIEQYDAVPEFTMGGKLTNKPFTMARAAIAKATGVTP